MARSFSCLSSLSVRFTRLPTDFALAQGDVLYELPELLAALYGIPEDAIICREAH